MIVELVKDDIVFHRFSDSSNCRIFEEEGKEFRIEDSNPNAFILKWDFGSFNYKLRPENIKSQLDKVHCTNDFLLLRPGSSTDYELFLFELKSDMKGEYKDQLLGGFFLFCYSFLLSYHYKSEALSKINDLSIRVYPVLVSNKKVRSSTNSPFPILPCGDFNVLHSTYGSSIIKIETLKKFSKPFNWRFEFS
jgi:hypothetical protein